MGMVWNEAVLASFKGNPRMCLKGQRNYRQDCRTVGQYSNT
jgi:hypothetical protein